MTDCSPTTPVNREYTITLAAWLALYMLLIAGVSWAHAHQMLSGPWVYAAAIAPSLPIGGVMAAVLRLLARSDEYVRAVLTKRFVLATGLTLFACTAYGFLETYADLPHQPLYLAFMVFWASFGVISPFVRSSR